jgi:hypothetical protein
VGDAFLVGRTDPRIRFSCLFTAAAFSLDFYIHFLNHGILSRTNNSIRKLDSNFYTNLKVDDNGFTSRYLFLPHSYFGYFRCLSTSFFVCSENSTWIDRAMVWYRWFSGSMRASRAQRSEQAYEKEFVELATFFSRKTATSIVEVWVSVASIVRGAERTWTFSKPHMRSPKTIFFMMVRTLSAKSDSTT